MPEGNVIYRALHSHGIYRSEVFRCAAVNQPENPVKLVSALGEDIVLNVCGVPR